MPFQKLEMKRYPPRHWALVGYPGAGKSTFAARMKGPFVVIDADQRFTEVARLASDEVYPVSQIAHEHTDPHAIARRLSENMPEAMATTARIGTIVIDSLTAIMAPKVVAAMVAKQEGEIKSLGGAWKDKALAMRELQDAVTRWGTDTLWIYHLNDARDDKGAANTRATVSATELVRLTRSINLQLQIVADGKRRGIKIVWSRKGREGMTLWDETGDWKGMPERIEAAAYDGLSQEDMDRKETSVPEVFQSHEIAVEWAMAQGAFDNITHAQNAYRKVMREKTPDNMRIMTPLWVAEVQRRLEEKRSTAMETIEQLKQAALDQEQKCQQAREMEEAEHAESLVHLREFVKTETPLGAEAVEITISPYTDNYQLVEFSLPGHAIISAKYYETGHYGDPKVWHHSKWNNYALWRVKEFQRIEIDSYGERYVPIYFFAEFNDLGQALLYAERKYSNPADIQREVEEKNAKAVLAKMKVNAAPEPTNAEILVDAMRNFVQEQVLIARELA